jgi:hypothetical protein
MAEQPSSEKHPPIPGTTAMVWFAVFLLVAFIGLTLFLQSKFGEPITF